MSNTPENVYDNLLGQLRGEFADEAEDQLNAMDILLENMRSGEVEAGEEQIKQIRRVSHSLKGSSSVADFPLVSLVMHRLEDYLSGVSKLSTNHLKDVQIYIDKAHKFSLLDFDQTSVSTADLSRELPEKRISGSDAPPTTISSNKIIEAMMVIKEKTAGLLFERELRAAGLRVTTVRNSFEAIEMTVRTEPDILIVSGVLDALTGVDVAAAISAMPTTSKIPVCLLTSFTKDHPDLKGLPDKVRLIRKSNLKEDLLETLNSLKLI